MIIANLFKKLLPEDLNKPAATTAATAPAAAAVAAPQAPASQPVPFPPRPTVSEAVAALPQQVHDSSILSARSLKQLGLFFAGATFLALSTTVTRRALNRSRLAAQLKFYSPSLTSEAAELAGSGLSAEAIAAQTTKEQPAGSLLAIEALNLATLNVVSFFIMMTGGFSWALDISSMDDLRARVQRVTRGSFSPDGSLMGDEEAERQIEQWAAKVLMRANGTLIGGNKKPEDENKD